MTNRSSEPVLPVRGNARIHGRLLKLIADLQIQAEEGGSLLDAIKIFNAHFSKSDANKMRRFYREAWLDTFSETLDTPGLLLIMCTLWHLACLEINKTLPLNAHGAVPRLIEVVEELARTQADDFELSLEKAARFHDFRGAPPPAKRTRPRH